MKGKTFKWKHALWVAIFLLSLLTTGSTQKCNAQFGLFDTLWTRNNQSIQVLSNNDSLLFLYNEQDTTSYLVNTLDLEQIKWSITSKYPISNVPLKFIENDNKILFLTWDKLRNKSHYKVRDATNFNVIDSVELNFTNFPYQNCSIYRNGISEVDTSVYYSGYCNSLDKKGISYKVNYKTGQATITSDSLPYFAMTLSKDGQYVAGIYYERRNITVKDSYYEILEVRRISDYSLVYKNERYYADYTPEFEPLLLVKQYELKFSKNNKYLLIRNEMQKIKIFDLTTNTEIYNSTSISGDYGINCFTNDSKGLFYKHMIFKYGYGMKIDKIEYCLLNLEKIQTTVYENIPEFPLFEFNKENLVLNDKFYLSTLGCAVYDSNYTKYRYLGDVSLIGLNFEINSFKEPEQKYLGILFPNPTNLNITLKLNLQLPVILKSELYNTEGTAIKSFGLKQYEQGENLVEFNVSGIPSGTYFLKVTGKDLSQSYKVLINK